MCETVPQPPNRIELTADRDAHGMPRARVVHTLAPQSRALWERAGAQGLRIVRAAGAEEAWTSPRPAFAHPAGGAVMGDDPASSAVEAFGRLHHARNVIVAGGALFPSIGAVSPTFTILALAERTAARLLDHQGEFDA